MPYAVTYLRIGSSSSELASESLEKFSESAELKNLHVEIEKILLSFGYPDFIIIIKGPNLELLKNGLLLIRDYLNKRGIKEVETSTIVGLTIEEMRIKTQAAERQEQ
ncbi:MAG: hypothetical protein ABSF65_00010 [Candidatus Bathyarchaeia archaeon]